jgi:hypothetical protein
LLICLTHIITERKRPVDHKSYEHSTKNKLKILNHAIKETHPRIHSCGCKASVHNQT